MALTQRKEPKSLLHYLSIAAAALAVAVSFAALAYSRYGSQGHSSGARDSKESVLDKIKRTRTIRAGYSNFRPYTILDPKAKDPDAQVTGFCADMIKEIATRQSPPWRVEWHKVTFESLRADMESGRFDVFADAVYMEVPRTADFGFTIPFSYFGVAVALVRRDEERFRRFEDLNREDITIALAEGWTSTQFARRHLLKPKFKLIIVGDDPFVQLHEVAAGRADVALQDIPTVLQYARAHPSQVKALWVDDPPTRVPAGFMTRQGEGDLLRFLDGTILSLQADGTIRGLDEKWHALSDFPEPVLRPGAGLKQE